MKEFFLRMFDARDASASHSRFLSVTTVLTILYGWLIVCLITRTVHDIPVGVCTFAGLVIAGSVGNKLAGKPTVGTTTTVETASKTVTGETNAK
ncbi:hypothetical protein EHM76_00585 [bacterium]|nr:MAG: hypothetical protein EHM76_00585 [bacterium]